MSDINDLVTHKELIDAYELEYSCWKCGGKGKITKKKRAIICNQCGGKGEFISELGIKILDFLRRHQ